MTFRKKNNDFDQSTLTLHPQSCIRSLSALRPVHDLIANDVVAQQSVGLLRRVPVIRNTSKTRLIYVNFVNCIRTI